MNNYKNLVDKGGFDFHCHTNVSDGKYSIYEVLDEAVGRGFSAICITDHNSVHKDIDEIIKTYEKQGLKVFVGAEVTATYSSDSGKNEEVHIVALDYKPEMMKAIFENNRDGRELYVRAILNKLRDAGVADIEYEELKKHFESYYLGRMHVAQMLAEKKAVSSVYEALDEYVGNLGKRKCWVSSKEFIKIPDMKTVVQAITNAGGIPILAHPFYYKSLTTDELEELIIKFKTYAGEKAGIEVYYKDYDEERTNILKRLAKKHELHPSGGSDYHGWGEKERIMQFNPCLLESLLR